MTRRWRLFPGILSASERLMCHRRQLQDTFISFRHDKAKLAWGQYGLYKVSFQGYMTNYMIFWNILHEIILQCLLALKYTWKYIGLTEQNIKCIWLGSMIILLTVLMLVTPLLWAQWLSAHGYLYFNLNVRRPSYLGLTWSISWLLIPWLFVSPGLLQPWYWLRRLGRFLSYLRKDLNYLHQEGECHNM